MAADTFSQILNTGIPIVIVVLFLVAIFKGFGPQLKAAASWVGGLFGKGKDAVSEAASSGGYDVVYSQ